MFIGTRILKRLLLLFIFVGIVVVLGMLANHYFSEEEPTPTPNPIDLLEPLEVMTANILNVKDFDYDFVARIRNPNQSYGSGNVQYSLKLYNDETENPEIFNGTFYILPGQTKYIVAPPIRAQHEIKKVEMKIESVNWKWLDSTSMPPVTFTVTNSALQTSGGDFYAKLRGYIANNSDVDVSRVDVAIILSDASENIIAVNRTEIYTFLAHTTRGFETNWFTPFDGTIENTVMEAHANLFEQSSFIRKYGGQEKFQTY